MSQPNYSSVCSACLDPISPDAPTVEVTLGTGERAKVHVECSKASEARTTLETVARLTDREPADVLAEMIEGVAQSRRPRGRMCGKEREG